MYRDLPKKIEIVRLDHKIWQPNCFHRMFEQIYTWLERRKGERDKEEAT